MLPFSNTAFLASLFAFFATPAFLWIVFFLAVIAFSAYSLVLFYHWREYGVGIYTGPLVSFIYIGVAAFFFFVMATAIFTL